jgi:polyhydroxybutyrate depolymerase
MTTRRAERHPHRGRRTRLLAILLLPLLLLGACSAPTTTLPTFGSTGFAPTSPTTSPEPSAEPSPSRTTLSVDGRDYVLVVPTGYRSDEPTGLVVGLHGYTSDAAGLNLYLGLASAAGRHHLLLALPQGTVDSAGDRFWNATSACCDFDRSGVDDSAYLGQVIEQVSTGWAVDPGRVYVVGHSNGAFMAHRFACDHPDQVAGVLSLAGVGDRDPASCPDGVPVAVLQVHGTADNRVPYAGSGDTPSAETTAQRWAARDGCTTPPTKGADLDLVDSTPGAETTITAWDDCAGPAAVELWTIRDGPHVPILHRDFTDTALEWLEKHSR